MTQEQAAEAAEEFVAAWEDLWDPELVTPARRSLVTGVTKLLFANVTAHAGPMAGLRPDVARMHAALREAEVIALAEEVLG